MGEKERKLKDRASRLYAEGKFKDALKLYEEILADDPAELQVRLKVGDLHRRIGNRSAAVDAYGGVAKAYAEDGLLLKAVAVCKMILALDAHHTHTQNMLADLYSRRSAPPRFPAPPKSEAPPGLDYGLVDFDEDSAPSAPGRPPVAWSGTAPMARGPVEWPSGTPIARGTPVAPPVAWPKAAAPAAPVAPSPPPVAWPATKPVAASISEASIKPKVSWPGTGVRVVQGAKVAPSIEDSVLDIVVDDDPMSRAVAEAAQEARQEAGLPVSSAEAAQASIEHSIELDMGPEGTWDQPVQLQDVDGPQQATQSVAAPVNELGLELGEVAALVAQELSGELVAPRFTEVEQVESPATEMEPRPETHGPAALADKLFSPDGFLQLASYVAATALACAGYGALFFVFGLFFRMPILPALAVLAWEFANFLLPAVLKKVSVVHYVESLLPVAVDPGPLAILASPSSPWVAIPGIALLVWALMRVASWRLSRVEVLYGAE